MNDIDVIRINDFFDKYEILQGIFIERSVLVHMIPYLRQAMMLKAIEIRRPVIVTPGTVWKVRIDSEIVEIEPRCIVRTSALTSAENSATHPEPFCKKNFVTHGVVISDEWNVELDSASCEKESRRQDCLGERHSS